MSIEQIAQSNIFFFVTTIAVIVLSTLLAIVLIQVIRILKNLDEVSKKINEEGKNIVADVSALRSGIKEKSKGAINIGLAILSQITSQFTTATRSTKKKKSK
ncbi:MAG: hypothetical protein RI996_529 [Candidatus Parcubacteria bacterium]|jgi:biopolymer transport protein ExbB/TolQ